MLRKEKKEFYGNLNTSILNENRTFWKFAIPFLADKAEKYSGITLIEDENIISEDCHVAKIFNNYFINIPIQNMPTH